MYSGGSYPRYAFASDPTNGPLYGVYYSISRLAGQAPSGQDAIRFTGVPTTDVIGDVGGADWGQSADMFGPLAQDVPVYIRWRERFVSPLTWIRAQDEGRGQWKSMIFGNNCESEPFMPTRVISFDRRGGDAPVDAVQVFASQNIGCAEPTNCATEPRPLHVLDEWTHIQYKLVPSSTGSATDAVLYAYVNNNDEASPSSVTPDGFQLKVDGWSTSNACGTNSNFRWGAGTFEPINENAELNCDWADFQIALTFDPSWAIGY